MEEYTKPVMEIILISDDVVAASDCSPECPEFNVVTPDLP